MDGLVRQRRAHHWQCPTHPGKIQMVMATFQSVSQLRCLPGESRCSHQDSARCHRHGRWSCIWPKGLIFSLIEQYFSNSQAFAWSLPRLYQVCWKMSLFVLFSGVIENIYLYNLFWVGIGYFFYYVYCITQSVILLFIMLFAFLFI